MATKQVEVKLLVSKWLREITKDINKYIEQGWVLQGAVTPVIKDGVTSFVATMVRYE